MCRSIKRLHNLGPPATEDEIRASALQFVRKVSGSHRPSQANETVFERAVADVSTAVRELLGELVTHAPSRDRQAEAARPRPR